MNVNGKLLYNICMQLLLTVHAHQEFVVVSGFFPDGVLTKSIASIGFMSARYLRNIHMRSRVGFIKQQVVATSAGCGNVDCREDAFVGQVAVELQLHVTCTLEFFEDNFVQF